MKLKAKNYIVLLIITIIFMISFSNNVFAGLQQEAFFSDENEDEIIFVTTSSAAQRNRARLFYNGDQINLYVANDNYSSFFNLSSGALNGGNIDINFTNRSDITAKINKGSDLSTLEFGKSSFGNEFGSISSVIKKGLSGNTNNFYMSLPIGIYESNKYNYTLNATDYAIKVSERDNGDYKLLGHRSEIGYKITNYGYHSYNKITSTGENSNIFEFMTDKTRANKENEVISYVSKVLALNCDKNSPNGNYIVNIDNDAKSQAAIQKAWGGSSVSYADLFYKMFKIKVTQKNVTVIHKYLDKNGKYIIEGGQTEKKIFKEDTLTASQNNKKISENYHYVGYKIIKSNSAKSLETEVDKVSDQNASKGYNYKDVVLKKDEINENNILVCFYYAPRSVEVSHIGIDDEGKEIELKVHQKEYLKPGEPDREYEYLGETYTYEKKNYKYIGLRSYASKSYNVAELKVLEATLRTKTTKYKVVDGFTDDGISWGYGDGEKFNTPSSHFIIFYYEVDGSEKEDNKKIYIRHIDESGNLLEGSKDKQYIDQGYVNNGTNIITNKSVTIPSGYSEYFIVKPESKATLRSLYPDVPEGYIYSGYKIGKADSKTQGESIRNSASINPGTSVFVNDKVKYIFVDFIYKKEGSEEPPTNPPSTDPINLTGRLCFINNPLDSNSSGYSASTLSEELDYIPSSKTMKGYVSQAYPVYFRRADWDIKNGNRTWKTSLGVQICVRFAFKVKDEEGNVTFTSYNGSYTDSKNFSYSVNVNYNYNSVTNLQMYTIDNMKLFDIESNVGGKLFKESNIVDLPVSDSYKNSVNAGISKGGPKVTFNTYYGNTYIEDLWLTDTFESEEEGFSAAKAKVEQMLSEWNNSSLAQRQGLKYEVTCENDSFSLPNRNSLFNPNFKMEMGNFYNNSDISINIDSSIANSNYVVNKSSYQDTETNKTLSKKDFKDNPILHIDEKQVNGIRIPSGRITYKIKSYGNSSKGTYSVGSTDYSDQTYEFNAQKENVNKVNILTPLNLGLSIQADKVVNHSDKNVVTLQKNSTFTIRPSLGTTSVAGYSNVDTNEFVKFYYIKCDFDITNLVVHGTKESNKGYVPYSKNDIIRNGTWIKVPAGGYITGKATQYTEVGGTTTNRLKNNIYCVAVAKNIPNALEEHIYNNITNSNYVFSEYTDVVNTLQYLGKDLRQRNYYTIQTITADAYHRVSTSIITSNLGRIFDFKLTDCSDLNFKDVFRETSSGDVNKPSGVVYFSGIKRLKIYTANSDVGYNDTEFVSNQKTILPLGPYKNTNQYKVEAPKLGYRFSYDLKTTGNLSNDDLVNGTRYVKITPSYYYISKSGTGYDENITLYYKNESGKYVPFVNSGYSIYFRPNDGYRNLSNKNITPNSNFLSTKLEKLDISNKNGFIINSKMVDTSGNNDNFIQTWYGEFKLPNSTIAVPNGGNINNTKTDGYIGVKFKIECIDTTEGNTVTISYNANDKSASGVNTTQWDYDGYAGFNTPGMAATNLKLSLEKGILNLDDNMYNKIKGTVVLYDTDNRAAQDFE